MYVIENLAEWKLGRNLKASISEQDYGVPKVLLSVESGKEQLHLVFYL